MTWEYRTASKVSCCRDWGQGGVGWGSERPCSQARPGEKEIKTGYLFVRNMTILRFANGLLWSLIFVSVNYVDSQEKIGELQGKTIVFKYYVKQYLNKKPSNDSF